jgi:hypothetical protein
MLYLVGYVLVCDADFGGGFNRVEFHEFPKICTANLEEAEKKYSEFAAEDSSWSGGFQRAYIIKATNEGKFEVVKGDNIERLLKLK